MPKRPYFLASVCYLAIPVVLFGGLAVLNRIDPEMAAGHAHYERNYRLLDGIRKGAMMSSAGLALVLWVFCCALVLRARKRSLRWLYLAAAGPFGFMVIASLRDRSPAPNDLYQQFIKNLAFYWRVVLEIAVLVFVWVLSYQAVVLDRNMVIRQESLATGTPISTIIAQQAAESGMYAGGEAMEQLYLVALMYLLRPGLFSLVGHLFASRSGTRQQDPVLPGD